MILEEQTEFRVEVVILGPITPLPNSDTLSITDVNGYPCIIKTGAFAPGDRAVYVPVDSLVPVSRPEFAFLAKPGVERHRIRAVRLRGTFSMGLLVPAAAEWPVGALVHEELGVEKYLTPSERRALNAPAQKTRRPVDNKFLPIYGLDPWRKFKDVLIEGEEVICTEKIHGCNARYCFKDGKLWVGSHKVMRGSSRSRLAEIWDRLRQKIRRALGRPGRTLTLETAGDVWWEAAEAYGLKEKCAAYPGVVFYGEIYGESVQDLTYDSPKGRKFRLFDLYDTVGRRFLDFDEYVSIAQSLELPTVPVLYRGPWRNDLVAELSEGKSTLANHLREGFVVRPAVERMDGRVGRVALKIVSEGYLLRKEAA